MAMERVTERRRADPELRECLDRLGNELQKVFGYIEIDQCNKAKPFVKLALRHLRQLQKLFYTAPIQK
jgi:hypothetical protein